MLESEKMLYKKKENASREIIAEISRKLKVRSLFLLLKANGEESHWRVKGGKWI